MNKFLTFLILIVVIPHFCKSQSDCNNPKVVNVICPGISLKGESSANSSNNMAKWGYYNIPTQGNETLYEVTVPPGSTSLFVSISAASQPLYMIFNNNICNTSFYNLMTPVFPDLNNYQISLSGSGPYYIWIDHNNPKDITYDISFGVATSKYVFIPSTNGNWTFSPKCINPITKPQIEITYNGIHQSVPIKYAGLGTEGKLCTKAFFENKTGIEAVQSFTFDFGPDIKNISAIASEMPGFYSAGTWKASTNGSQITYTFNDAAGTGSGDFNPSGIKSCLGYEFCFNITPVSHDSVKTDIVLSAYSDGKGAGFAGNITNGCCTPGTSCSALAGGGGGGRKGLSVSFNDPAVLPIKLLSLNARKEHELVFISWTTIEESNSDAFAIERSEDGIHFSEIGKVRAAGASYTLKEYSYTDINVPGGIQYYRLKEIDRDGQFWTSRIVAVKSEQDEIIIYPMPAKNYLTIEANSEWNSIELLDPAGLTIIRKEEKDKSSILNISGVKPGLYFLTISFSDRKEIKKVIIE